MKKIKIEITHNLTPFHEETMLKMVQGSLEALNIFWNSKSKKIFKISYEDNNIPFKGKIK